MKNIFISSTFRDMQAERDMVQEVVLPALKEEARRYGDNVGVIDLRWGVDTSALETDEGSAKVLSVCLDEIDRSHPYMLIFLGDRYGWIPEGKLIERAVRDRADKFETEDFEKSVTALEIEYGALSEKYGQSDRCIVCLREPVRGIVKANEETIYLEQNEKALQKLNALKERIQKEMGSNVISYTCSWSETEGELSEFRANGMPLSDVIIERYIELFREDWEEYEAMSWQAKEQLAFKSLMESKLRAFVGREKLIENYYGKAVSGTVPFVVRGKVGTGKTAVMCKLIERMQKEGKKVFPFFSGMGTMSGSVEQMVKQMVYYLENVLGFTEHFGEKKAEDEANWGIDDILHGDREEQSLRYSNWVDRLKKLEKQLPEDERVYFCIDALDQLYGDEHVKNLDFLCTSEKIQFIMSCTDTFSLQGKMVVKMEVEDIPELSPEDAKAVAEGVLASYSRNAYSAIIKEIMLKKNIGNPLYISLLVQRLNMMDSVELYEAQTEQEIIELGTTIVRNMPEDVENAVVSIMENAIDKVSDREGELREIVRFLAVSRHGLRLQDLRVIVERRQQTFPALDFSRLLKYLDSFFYINEDDRIEFTHKVIRGGLLCGIGDKSVYEQQIGEYLEILESRDTLRVREGMYYARILHNVSFARELLIQASRKGKDEFYKGIKEEALADEGRFYCDIIGTLPEDFDIEVQNFFMNLFSVLLDVSYKEMLTELVVEKALLDCNRRICEKTSSLRNLRNVVTSTNEVGKVLRRLGRKKEALSYGESALIACEELYKRSPDDGTVRELIDCYNSVGRELRENGETESALTYLKKALYLAEEQYEKQLDIRSLRDLGSCYSNIGQAYYMLGQYEESLKYGTKAYNCGKLLIKKDVSLTALAKYGSYNCYVGRTLRKLGRTEEAVHYHEMDLECTRNAYRLMPELPQMRDLAICLGDLGNVYQELGKENECLTCWLEAFDYYKKLWTVRQTDQSAKEYSDCCYKIAKQLEKMGETERALMFYECDLACMETLNKNAPDVSKENLLYNSCYRIAVLKEKIGRDDEALYYYQRVAEGKMGLIGKEGIENPKDVLAICFYKIARLWERKGKYAEAVAAYILDIQYNEELYELNADDTRLNSLCECCMHVGDMLRQMEKWENALTFYEKAIVFGNQYCGKEMEEKFHKRLGLGYFRKGTVLETLEKTEEAAGVYESAMKYLRQTYSRSKSADALQMLGMCYYKIGKIFEKQKKYEEAKCFLELDLKCSEELYESNPDSKNAGDLAFGYNSVGRMLEETGYVGEAVEYYKKAEKIREKLCRENPSEKEWINLRSTYMNLAYALATLGAEEEGLSYNQKALQCLFEIEKINPDADLTVAFGNTYGNTANVLKEMGRTDEALEYYQKSLKYKKEVFEKTQKTDDLIKIRVSCEKIGEILASLGRREEAMAAYEEAYLHAKSIRDKLQTVGSKRDCAFVAISLTGVYVAKADECMESREYDKTMALCEKGLDCFKEIYDETIVEAVRGYAGMLKITAEYLQEQGKGEDALFYLGVARKEAEILCEHSFREQDQMLLDEILEMLKKY